MFAWARLIDKWNSVGGFLGGLVVKNSSASAGDARDTGLIPGSGRFPGGRNVNPLQYSCLENPSGREAWQATVRGVTENQTQLSDLHTYLTTVSNSSPFLGHIAFIIFMSLCIHTTLL